MRMSFASSTDWQSLAGCPGHAENGKWWRTDGEAFGEGTGQEAHATPAAAGGGRGDQPRDHARRQGGPLYVVQSLETRMRRSPGGASRERSGEPLIQH